MAVKQKQFKKISANRVSIFKIKNRRGYAAVSMKNLTEGRTALQAFSRMVKAVKRSGFRLDGNLLRHRIWAELESAPDGICLDAEGALWIALPYAGQVVRVAKGGKILDRAQPTSDAPVACTLGGASRRTLFVVTAPIVKSLDDLVGTYHARAETVSVDVSGAGWP